MVMTFSKRWISLLVVSLFLPSSRTTDVGMCGTARLDGQHVSGGGSLRADGSGKGSRTLCQEHN
jgi:hypothetical protein